MKKIIFLIILATQFTFSQSAALDNTFNVGGSGADEQIRKAAIQPDGKIFVAGDFTSYNGSAARKYITKLNDDGSVDSSFIPADIDNYIYTFFVYPDGKVLIGGSFTTVGGFPSSNIARLNADGSLDTTFNPGSGFDGMVFDLHVYSNGKILVGGRFFNYNGFNRRGIVRLDANGSLDSTFNIDFTNGFNGSDIHSFKVQSDDKIIIGGFFNLVNSVVRRNLARINADGSLDTSFASNTGTDFTPASGGIYSVVLQPDGKVLIGGIFTQSNSQPRNKISRLNTDGTIDLSFNVGSAALNNSVRSIFVLPDNKIMVGGDFLQFADYTRQSIVRINADGTIDLTFEPLIGFASGGVYDMAVQADQKLLVFGSFSSYDNVIKNNILRLNGDALATDSFNFSTAISVYPNPTSSILNIQNQNNSQIDKIVVSDLTGKKVLEQKNAKQVNVANLAKGMYVLEVFSGEEKWVSKFVKE